MGVKTYHVGVDLHWNNFTYCMRNSNGEAKRYNSYLFHFHEGIKMRRGETKANIAPARNFLEIIYRTLKNNWIFEDFTRFKIAKT